MDHEAQKQFIRAKYPKAISWKWVDGYSIYSKYPSGILLGDGKTETSAWTTAYENLKREIKQIDIS